MFSEKARRAIKRMTKRELEGRRDWLALRQQEAALIAECAEGGKVAMVWSGRDCDGVAYSGSVYVVPALLVAVLREADDQFSWADGPCNYCLMKPSDAAEIEYSSRDLAMEAYEDGHAHCLFV